MLTTVLTGALSARCRFWWKLAGNPPLGNVLTGSWSSWRLLLAGRITRLTYVPTRGDNRDIPAIVPHVEKDDSGHRCCILRGGYFLTDTSARAFWLVLTPTNHLPFPLLWPEEIPGGRGFETFTENPAKRRLGCVPACVPSLCVPNCLDWVAAFRVLIRPLSCTRSALRPVAGPWPLDNLSGNIRDAPAGAGGAQQGQEGRVTWMRALPGAWQCRRTGRWQGRRR